MSASILVLAAVCCLAVDSTTITPDNCSANTDLPRTDRTCSDVQRFVPRISCEPDGSYSPRQCTREGTLCACVDTETGERLDQYPPFPSASSVDCVQTFPVDDDGACPDLQCDNMCLFGNVEDRSGCRTCVCRGADNVGGEEKEEEEEEEGMEEGEGEEVYEGETECDKIGCTSIAQLVRRGCTRKCLIVEDGCPTCNRTCVDAQPDDEAECTTDSNCEEDQLCLPVGVFGQRNCIDLLDEGDECEASVSADEKSSAIVNALKGTSFGAVARGSLTHLERANIPCKSGLACARVSLLRKECTLESQDGPCVVARRINAQLSCSDDGYYNPLQCRRMSDTTFECICVRRDGTSIQNTATVVDSRDDAPDCEDIVFDGCEVEIGGETFKARHGSVILIPANCSRCLCFDGEAQHCRETRENCSSLLTDVKRSCSVEGVGDVEHGEIFKVDCNLCRCWNGRVTCSHTRCEEEEEKDTPCMRCRFLPRGPVCGPDGGTYQSRCYARECVGLSLLQLLPGPCARYDVCELYPCEAGEMCVKKGGVSCFNLEGCQASDVRMCLNPGNLVCEKQDEEEENCDIGVKSNDTEEEEEEKDGYVCSTSGRSYRSICHMLQDTAFTAQVAHIGRCNARVCRDGPVCGTDGVTYENICLLRSQSGSGRVDYSGDCVSVSGDASVEAVCSNIREKARCRFTRQNCRRLVRPEEGCCPICVEAVCSNIREKARCQFTRQNCRRLVRPEEGCCPICGGSLIASIDGVGLRDYIRLNPSQQDTLDALLEQLVPYLNIPDECELEGALTSTGNLEIILTSSDEDSELCNNETERIAEQLNNGDDGSREARPPLLQFISTAVTAPLVEGTDENGLGGGGGENGGLPLVAPTILLLLAIFFSAFTN